LHTRQNLASPTPDGVDVDVVAVDGVDVDVVAVDGVDVDVVAVDGVEVIVDGGVDGDGVEVIVDGGVDGGVVVVSAVRGVAAASGMVIHGAVRFCEPSVARFRFLAGGSTPSMMFTNQKYTCSTPLVLPLDI
jgi:hypothetical protein